MSLALEQSGPDAPRIVGVVCDCCHAEVGDEIDLQEVVHLRLHAGCGSVCGFGNTFELDLCDACGHRTFAPYARVVPSTEVLRGHVARRFDARQVEAGLIAFTGVHVRTMVDARAPSPRVYSAWTWIKHQVVRHFLPAKVLLSPVFGARLGFAQAAEREEQV